MLDNGSNNIGASDYYGALAYRSCAIPPQKNQREELNRSRLERSASLRLPWGNTRAVMPPNLMLRHSPKKLRKLEKKEDLADKLGLQVENSHECFRHAPLAFQARFFDMMSVLGQVWTYLVSPMYVITLILMSPLFGSSDKSLLGYLQSLSLPNFLILGGGLILLLIPDLAMRIFPNWLFRNGRGPEWEFNRRTGMITVWQYSRKILFRPAKPPVIIEKPFYEFDAWCCARMDRFGTLFDLVLSHRYSKLNATVGDILGAHGSATMCYAYWDFIQNYMDVTRPLPDLPLLERYRPLDPVTAESDRKTGRAPRYWRDMDNETFKKKVNRMFTDVSIIDTAQRPNLMAERLDYAT